MKSRNFALRFVVTVIIGFLVWYFLRPKAHLPDKAATAPVSAQADAPKSATMPIATPIVPSVAKSGQAPQLTLVEANLSNTQKELNVVIDDLATMLQAGDIDGMSQKYTPPEDLAKLSPGGNAPRAQQAQQMLSTPMGQLIIQNQVQALQSLKDQLPELNAARDEATYQMTTPAIKQPGINFPERTQVVVFQKIDGRWYIKGGGQGL